MNWNSVKCFLVGHKYQTIAYDDTYYTIHKVKGHDDFTSYHLMKFIECSCCGKRKFGVEYNRYYMNPLEHHVGTQIARMKWLDFRITTKNRVLTNPKMFASEGNDNVVQLKVVSDNTKSDDDGA